MTTIFTLPTPPSLNNLFFNRRGWGRGKSKVLFQANEALRTGANK